MLTFLFGESNYNPIIPKIDGLIGAIISISFSLFPYVYVLTRASFYYQSNNYIEVGKNLGLSSKETFLRIVLPLSIPAFASIFILQFLWVWNDLLVGLVFLDQVPSEIILSAKLRELLGSRGENWEILTTGAFISMTIPLLIFFSLQRYFIRGLVAGSVKG